MAQRQNVFSRLVGNIASAPARLLGEMSKLRRPTSWGLRVGALSTYRLDSSRVDYELARALYHNTEDRYKLGGAFARPIVNTAVGFMGVPRFRIEDEEAQEVLDSFFGANVSAMQQTHRDALRDGDCWVWVTREEESNRDLYPELRRGVRLVYNILPPEQVADVRRDPFTGRPVEYILQSEYEWFDGRDQRKRAKIIQRISAARRLIQVDGPIPPGVTPGEEPNPWGFIPIVHFANERESGSAFGRSDLEPVEPFIKAYHDVMLHAIQGSKLHSTPRLKVQLKDVASFLRNNFGVEDPVKFAQEGRTISLEGKELLIFSDDEDADFIEVSSATGAAETLLKFLFYCIIDVSETPEFAFGTHTPSSHASVTEQMPVLVRRVARKREHFTQSWQDLARIVLAMVAKAEGRSFTTHETTLLWDPVADRDEKAEAETLSLVVNALARAIESDILGQESAVEFLAQYIDTMGEWISDDPEVPGERERIIRTKLLRARLDDSELAEKELQEIERILASLGARG